MEKLTDNYVLTSPSFEGEIRFGYDTDTGLLHHFEAAAFLSPIQHKYLLDRWPKHIKDIDSLKTNNNKIVLIKAEVNFEQFWEKYNYKVDKETAKRRWKNMTTIDRIKAFNYINRYCTIIEQQQVAKMYPSTYLNKQRWND